MQESGDGHIVQVLKNVPPKPVAKPTVPSVASISTQNEPKTLIPQLVRDARYFSHLDIGVEIGVSINLQNISVRYVWLDDRDNLPVSTLHIVVVPARSDSINDIRPDSLDLGE